MLHAFIFRFMKSDLGLHHFDHINHIITLWVIKLWSFHCNILLEGFCFLHWDSCFLNLILFKKLFEFRGGNTTIKTLQTCFSFRCSCLRNFCVWWSLFVSCSRTFSLSTFSFFNLNFGSLQLDNILDSVFYVWQFHYSG